MTSKRILKKWAKQGREIPSMPKPRFKPAFLGEQLIRYSYNDLNSLDSKHDLLTCATVDDQGHVHLDYDALKERGLYSDFPRHLTIIRYINGLRDAVKELAPERQKGLSTLELLEGIAIMREGGSE